MMPLAPALVVCPRDGPPYCTVSLIVQPTVSAVGCRRRRCYGMPVLYEYDIQPL